MASRYAPGMTQPLVHPPKAQPGDRIAVVSPSFAAPGFAPAVHEQAMRRLAEVTGLVPVEYPTTRQLGASPEDRARDLNAAFADPQIRAVIATVGGEDQITVIGHLDADAVRADPKPFLGSVISSRPPVSRAARRDAACTSSTAGPGPRCTWVEPP